MVQKFKRRLKLKKIKTSSRVRKSYFKGKQVKRKCAITGKVLSGTTHATKCDKNKESKTQRKPSAPFGGVLSGEAREQVFIELGKVLAGVKGIEDVDTKYKGYVKQAMKRTES